MSLSIVNDAKTASEMPDPSIVLVPKIPDPWTVDKALAAIPMDNPVEGSNSPVPYFHLLEQLKITKREGWRRFGINRRVHRGSYVPNVPDFDAPTPVPCETPRPTQMHEDVPDSRHGGIACRRSDTCGPGSQGGEASTRGCDYGLYYKAAIGKCPWYVTAGKEIRDIWQEHEDSESLESQYVQDIDKVELLLQMVEYEKRGQGKIYLDEFAYVETKIRLPEMKSWAEQILKERDELWGSKKLTHGAEEGKTREMQDQYYGDGSS